MSTSKNIVPKEKLVLFDIDGTLTSVTDKSIEYWKLRIRAVFEKVFQVPFDIEINAHDYNGMVDRKVLRKIAERLGISNEKYDARFEDVRQVFHEFLSEAVLSKKIKYSPIKDAHKLISKLKKNPHICLALVTGNVEKNAWLKLRNAELHSYFSVGGFGDFVEERSDLVKLAITNSSQYYRKTFINQEVIVIGDTKHDIFAAKSVGAYALGVSTGHTDTTKTLADAKADLVVDSLMDERVLSLLGLNK